MNLPFLAGAAGVDDEADFAGAAGVDDEAAGAGVVVAAAA